MYCLLLRIWGYPSTFTPVVGLQHISDWQHHFLCSRRFTEHIYIGHYLYSFHVHGTIFCSLSVRTTLGTSHFSRMTTLAGSAKDVTPTVTSLARSAEDAISSKVGRGRHLSKVGRGPHLSNVGRGRHLSNGRGRHTDGDVSSKVSR